MDGAAGIDFGPGGICLCVCCYDVENTISDLAPGMYIAEYCWEDYDDLLSCHVETIVIEQLGVDAADVTAEKSFVEDLNADSLDLTELIMTFEERFGCEIAEEEAEKLKTVGDVVSYISSQKKD